MRIGIASDHAGFEYKQLIAEHLRGLGHEVCDFGTDSPKMVDYPRFIRPAAEAVARGEVDGAVVLGVSGNVPASISRIRLPGAQRPFDTPNGLW